MPPNLEAIYGSDRDAALVKMSHVIEAAGRVEGVTSLSAEQATRIAEAVLTGGVGPADADNVLQFQERAQRDVSQTQNGVRFFKFFVSYDYDGRRWVFEMWARNRAEADVKLTALKQTASLDRAGPLIVHPS